MIETGLNIATAAFALVAAAFWFRSASVKGFESRTTIAAKPLQEVGRWSQRAAISAGLSASCQALTVALNAFH